jgi:hypothetical protein
MEVKIYLIEDINDLRYVGSTKQDLNKRLSEHKSDKKSNRNTCSSNQLNLYNCIITELECCDESSRREREQYWIDTIDCVNQYNTVFDSKEYYEKNKEQKKEYSKEWREKHKDYNKQYYQKNKEYFKEYFKEYRENNKEQKKEYDKERSKLDWYCPHCKCNVRLHNKARHLKTKRHQLNTNNYIE